MVLNSLLNKMSKIGIVIPVVGKWDSMTKPCLDSIVTKHDKRIVIVDNVSHDNSLAEGMKLVGDNFHYKRNEENMGVTWAWNYGLRDCFVNHGCDYVFVINNDVVFHHEAIDRLVARFEVSKELENKSILIEGNGEKIADVPIGDGVVMVTCMNIRGDCNDIPTNIFKKNARDYEKVEEAEHPDFSAYMVSRKFWDKVGEFDEAYSVIGKAYFEDNDMHRRIKLLGFKAINCPSAIYYHHGSQSSAIAFGMTLIKNIHFEKNRDYFKYKWGGMPDTDGMNTLPFGDSKKYVDWTWQNSHKGDCDCDVKCKDIRAKFGYE